MIIVPPKPDTAPQAASIRGAAMDRKIAAPKWRRPLQLAAAAIVVVAAAGAYALWAPAPGRTLRVENANVTVSEVARGSFEDFVPIRGRVTPLTTLYLDAVEGGRVEKIYVEDGATLKAGDPIVDLSNTALQLDAISREAQVIEQLNNLKTLELTLERDRLQHQSDLVEIDYQITRLGRLLERRQALLKTNSISLAEFQNTEDEYHFNQRKREVTAETQRTTERLQREQLSQLKEATAHLQSNLEFARKNLDSLKVRAPVDGKLTAFDVQVGQSLGAGARLGQIDDPSSYKVVAEIDEFYLNRIDVQQAASLSAGSHTYPLKIAKIYPQVRDGHFSVDLVFTADRPNDIRRGQTMQLKLTLGDTTEALLVPDGAFYQDTGGNWVFVVDDAGKRAVRRNVRLGRHNARFIEVLEGLEPGEHVITSPYTSFLDKDRLELAP